jgi:ketosteroid isomerase-like protein
VSQENLEIVRRAYEAFAAGGFDAVAPFFAPDAVHHAYPEWVSESVYRGPDGLRTLVAEGTDNFDGFEFDVREIRQVGDNVLMLGETVGQIKGSGVPIRQPLGAVYSDFRDGQIGEARNFLTWREALEAVGLRE